MRIAVVGSPGSGKSTLSRAIAERLGVPRLELDGVFHQAGWVPLEEGEFRERVGQFVAQPAWVSDGNYADRVGDLIWAAADQVVWLDLPRRTVMRRVVWRTIRRGLSREELWNGNRESVWQLLQPRAEDNMALWTWTRFAGYRERYLAAMADADGPQVVRLCSTAEIADWLGAL